MNTRLFIGYFATGISYADTEQEQYGDYKKLAFLSYRTLKLDWYDPCPLDLRPLILAHAVSIQARSGEELQVTITGQSVRLGTGA